MAHCFGSQGHKTRIFIQNIYRYIYMWPSNLCIISPTCIYTWAGTQRVNTLATGQLSCLPTVPYWHVLAVVTKVVMLVHKSDICDVRIPFISKYNFYYLQSFNLFNYSLPSFKPTNIFNDAVFTTIFYACKNQTTNTLNVLAFSCVVFLRISCLAIVLMMLCFMCNQALFFQN